MIVNQVHSQCVCVNEVLTCNIIPFYPLSPVSSLRLLSPPPLLQRIKAMDHTTEGSAIGSAVAAHVLFAPLTTALMAPPAAALSVFWYAPRVEKDTLKVFVRMAHCTLYTVHCTLYTVRTPFHHLSIHH